MGAIDLTGRAGRVAAAGVADDEATVRGLFAELLAAWGRGDGTAYGAIFTDDADYIAFDGSATKGRATIASQHQELFDTWLKGTRLVGSITALRFLGPDVALVHATGGTVMPGRTAASGSRDSIQTLVATRGDDGWRFAAFHNCRIQRRSRLGMIIFGIVTKVFRR